MKSKAEIKNYLKKREIERKEKIKNKIEECNNNIENYVEEKIIKEMKVYDYCSISSDEIISIIKNESKEELEIYEDDIEYFLKKELKKELKRKGYYVILYDSKRIFIYWSIKDFIVYIIFEQCPFIFNITIAIIGIIAMILVCIYYFNF